MAMSELWRMTARNVVSLLKRRELTPLDLIDASLKRIEKTNPALNSLPTICADRARRHARRIELSDENSILSGLPVAVKDLNDVQGVRTTYGSPLFAEHIPDGSDAMVEILEENGGIVIAKSNAPEFGHGANTFNDVFGKTRNPWNTGLTCGGSSGGSAVAVASGQTWAATGSDFGCSLRTPAAFCSVVGLRPSPGRIARSRVRLPFDNLWVQGPMARNVGDVALLLDAMVGVHPLDPISIERPGIAFVNAVDEPRVPRRIAFSPDLGGTVRISRQMRELFSDAVRKLSALNVPIDEACPDLGDAGSIYEILRANQFVGDLGPIIEDHRDRVKPELVDNYARGKAMSVEKLAKAEIQRGKLYERVARFFETYDLLIVPSTAVLPFDIEMKYLKDIDGQPLNYYYEWYAICYSLTLTALPILSLPCGFTADGLPVALQLVGPPRGEHRLLSYAALLEDIFGVNGATPIDARSAEEARTATAPVA
jgi:amidase